MAATTATVDLHTPSIPLPPDALLASTDPNAEEEEEPPISPLERKNTLEKHLQLRPETQDLKNRNILRDTTAAPSLQAAQLELERQRASDYLKKGLAKRSDREELEQRNILPTSPTRFNASLSPGLQSSARELERHMRRDSLEKQLSRRPAPEDLIQKGVMSPDENPFKEE